MFLDAANTEGNKVCKIPVKLNCIQHLIIHRLIFSNITMERWTGSVWMGSFYMMFIKGAIKRNHLI